jgi:hypothetical protein
MNVFTAIFYILSVIPASLPLILKREIVKHSSKRCGTHTFSSLEAHLIPLCMLGHSKAAGKASALVPETVCYWLLRIHFITGALLVFGYKVQVFCTHLTQHPLIQHTQRRLYGVPLCSICEGPSAQHSQPQLCCIPATCKITRCQCNQFSSVMCTCLISIWHHRGSMQKRQACEIMD